MNTYFITYGDEHYTLSKQRLLRQAKNFGEFTHCIAYSYTDLDPDFKEKFKDILINKRGAGYWIWKFQIIKQTLNLMNDNDILIYADAGCSINPHGKNRFHEYITLLNKSDYGFLSFQSTHPENNFTTQQLFNYFNIPTNSNITTSGQYIATCLFIKKNNHSLTILNTIFKLLNDHPLLITDTYNKISQSPVFVDHRHDQSILSIVRKIHGSVVVPDETYFVPFGSNISLNFPIWATRIRD